MDPTGWTNLKAWNIRTATTSPKGFGILKLDFVAIDTGL